MSVLFDKAAASRRASTDNCIQSVTREIRMARERCECTARVIIEDSAMRTRVASLLKDSGYRIVSYGESTLYIYW